MVFINAQSSELWDRSVLADTYSDTLVENVASKCKNTMVIIYNAGIRPVDLWVNYPNRGITLRYAFGFGLTYSNFSYTSLVIRRTPDVCTLVVPPDALSPSTVAPEGGLSSLYDVIATVGVTVTNTGKVAAAEVAQLYVGIPNSGLPKALRGFDKQLIQPGKSVSFSFPLRRRDLSTWDTFSQQWVLRSGSYAIMVGKSVLDIQLQGTFSL
ncbi:hypothetical protein D6C78_06427 [Aureobasidium pullulans]|uniref:beta-glucosidase n=1 Tax=Aureobasidium pullulans TaxID=5580 RepID=A0A4T0BKF1_AURPU|nr:hypothetical protein D6C78_06427 [Aureobasidium pullulans]